MNEDRPKHTPIRRSRAKAKALSRRMPMLRPEATYIGVTGSVGKTSTKEFAHSLLSAYFGGTKTYDNYNRAIDIKTSILSLSKNDRFVVAEVAASGIDTLDESVEMLQPDIGVVTTVRQDHYSSFRGRENVYKEKRKLIKALDESGIAVLNCDDDFVRRMADDCRGRIIWVGESDTADVRAVDVTASWPDRLEFTLLVNGESHQVQTRLVGEVLLGSVLAAFGIVVAMGLPLEPAIASARELVPFHGRMSVHERDDGVTFIRDEAKASADSLDGAMDFCKQARAKRKIFVLGKIADYPGSEGLKMRAALRNIADDVDLAIVVHGNAESIFRKFDRESYRNFRLFETVRDASRFLNGYVESGDLVVLKSGSILRLRRLLLDQPAHPVHCWINSCEKRISCESCAMFLEPLGLKRGLVGIS